MFVITNRRVDAKKTGLDAFGKAPNPAGPNELRMVEVTGTRRFRVSVLQDQLHKNEVKALADKYQLKIEPDQPWYASLRVACELFDRSRKEKKQLLLFVHGSSGFSAAFSRVEKRNSYCIIMQTSMYIVSPLASRRIRTTARCFFNAKPPPELVCL